MGLLVCAVHLEDPLPHPAGLQDLEVTAAQPAPHGSSAQGHTGLGEQLTPIATRRRRAAPLVAGAQRLASSGLEALDVAVDPAIRN